MEGGEFVFLPKGSEMGTFPANLASQALESLPRVRKFQILIMLLRQRNGVTSVPKGS